MTVLSSPNDNFRTKALPTVRFMSIECCDADFYGRLYLPPNYKEGMKYPLVFTNYISGPGFDASVGDEVPILALTARGIAVFAMNSSEADSVSTTGDFRFEIGRVEATPCDAVGLSQIDGENIVDPDRRGLTGLSYDSEIAMYSYWKSRIFRTLGVATSSWEAMNYLLGGVSYSKLLDSRGFAAPNDETYAKWKELSAGLNARPDLPPLLLQCPDDEEYLGNIETWFRLRRAGAQVECYEYPGEGHVKRNPTNKW